MGVTRTGCVFAVFAALCGCGDSTSNTSDAAPPLGGINAIMGTSSSTVAPTVITGRALLAGQDDHGGILVENASRAITASTTSDGRFQLVVQTDTDPAPSQVTISFSKAGYETAETMIELRVGETNILPSDTILTPRNGMVSGRIVLPIGLVWSDYLEALSVKVIDDAQNDVIAPIGDEGRYQFVDLTPGRYRIEVSGDPFVTGGLSVNVGPGGRIIAPDIVLRIVESQRAALETAVEGVVRLQGVTDEAGHGDVFVELVDGDSTTATRPDGSFRLLVAPGEPTIRLSKTGYGAVVLPIGEIEPRSTTVLPEPVVLAARPGRIVGQVRLREFGTPSRVQAIDVQLYGDGQNPFSTSRPDARGRFIVDNVPIGEWRIVVGRAAYLPQTRSMQVGPGDEVDAGEFALRHTSQSDDAVRFAGQVLLNGQGDHGGTTVEVRIEPEGLTQALTLTDADGDFDVAASRDERYSVVVTRPRYATPNHWGPFSFNAQTDAFETDDGTQPVTTLELFDGPQGDIDGDGIVNGDDNCLNVVNIDQTNTDDDALGDACDDDRDNDGLSNAEEVAIGTSTLDADTDGDGLSDFYEHRGATDPTTVDTDGDGLSDGEETPDPLNPPDFDEDGLVDAIESAVRDADRDGAPDQIDGPGPLGDLDGDGIANGIVDVDQRCLPDSDCDNCATVANGDQTDTDRDGLGDACDDDDDADERVDQNDNCPLVFNPRQLDTDRDQVGDACDDDDDGDGLIDALEVELGSNPLRVDSDFDGHRDGDGVEAVDNCVIDYNPMQADADDDGRGDVCDNDDDDDGADDWRDNCPFVKNNAGEDALLNTDGDAFGDACDVDDDNDSILDGFDNCPRVANPLQENFDDDLHGDACDGDDDNDGVADVIDNCPFTYNPQQLDANNDRIGNVCAADFDGDGVMDGIDNCPTDHNPSQADLDSDTIGDACDDDLDGDGLLNVDDDNCATVANPRQADNDEDEVGDACDPDDDNDGIDDLDDSCPLLANVNLDPDADNIDSVCDRCPDVHDPYQLDLDGDELGDRCDPDLDGDGIANVADNCVYLANPNQADRNQNQVGDACDQTFLTHLSDRAVTDVARQGEVLWVTSDGGGATRYRYSEGRYERTRFDTAQGLPTNQVYHVGLDEAGNGFFVTDLGLLGFSQATESWGAIGLDDQQLAACGGRDEGANAVDVVAHPLDGSVYLAFDDGIVRKSVNTTQCIQRGAGRFEGQVRVIGLDGQQRLWVGTTQGLWRRNAVGDWSSFIANDGTSPTQVRDLDFRAASTFALSDEHVWSISAADVVLQEYVGPMLGLAVDGETLYVHDRQTIQNHGALPNAQPTVAGPWNDLRALVVSPAGRLTAFVDGKPTMALNSDEVGDTLATQPSAVTNTLFGLVLGIDGQAVVLTPGDGEGVAPVAYTIDDAEVWHTADHVVGTGTLVTRDGRIINYGPTGLTVDGIAYTQDAGLPANEIRRVIEDPDGHLWIATTGGLSRMVDNAFQTIDPTEVNELVLDFDDRLWVATASGLFWVNGTRLESVIGVGDVPVRQILLDAQGGLWGRDDARVFRRVGVRQFVDYTLDEGASAIPTSLAALADGRLAVGSANQGLFIIHPDGQIEQFDRNHGLPANVVQAVISETTEPYRTFIATLGGLTQFVAQPLPLLAPVCGDGLVAFAEACDDRGVRTARCDLNCQVTQCGLDEPNACGECGPLPADVCDGFDNDCDGRLDEEGAQQCGDTIPYVASALCVAGACAVDGCEAGRVDADGFASNGCECNLENDAVEVCNGQDDDCDGMVDEDGVQCPLLGAADVASLACVDGQCVVDQCVPGYRDVDGAPANGCECQIRFDDSLEQCNGMDDDCDGRIDEEMAGGCDAGDVPVVQAVPWSQSNPALPHPAVAGQPTPLQAVAIGSSCPEGEFKYRWDVNGDGQYLGPDEVWRSTRAGGIRGGYYAPLGGVVSFEHRAYTRTMMPTVQVTCADGGPSVSASVPYVLLGTDTLCALTENGQLRCENEQNSAVSAQHYLDWGVDRALWTLFNRFIHFDDDGRRDGVHTCVQPAAGRSQLFEHGHVLNAFLRRGHGHGPNRALDPYYALSTRCGVNGLVGTYAMTTGSWFNDTESLGWDNWRIAYVGARLGQDPFWSSYAASAWVEPLALFAQPGHVLSGGEANVRNRSIQSIAQDLVDGLMYCLGPSHRWHYTCQSDGLDPSTNAWAASAVAALERSLKVDGYSWSKTNQRQVIAEACQVSGGDGHLGCAYSPSADVDGFGKLAGDALSTLGWTQNLDFGNAFGLSANQLSGLWLSISSVDTRQWGSYFMYSKTRAKYAFEPPLVDEPDAAETTTEMGLFLVAKQNDEGVITWCSQDVEVTDQPCLWAESQDLSAYGGTALGLQVMQSWSTIRPVASPEHTAVPPGAFVSFKHSDTHRLHPGASAVRYNWSIGHGSRTSLGDEGAAEHDARWSFSTERLDDVFEVTFADAIGWDEVWYYPVTLEVVDAHGARRNDVRFEVRVSYENHPPVVISHPDGEGSSYRATPGATVQIDARGAYDLDAAPRNFDVFPGAEGRPAGVADRITSVCVDIDHDDQWCEDGEQGLENAVAYTVANTASPGSQILVPIRVCDDGRWNGRCYESADNADPQWTRDECSRCGFGHAVIDVR